MQTTRRGMVAEERAALKNSPISEHRVAFRDAIRVLELGAIPIVDLPPSKAPTIG
jgi:hypothetical protein